MNLQKAATKSGFFSLIKATLLFMLAMIFNPISAFASEEKKLIMGLQEAQSPVMKDIVWFHDKVILPIEIAISLFVLALLVYVIFRFNEKANPKPATFTHNTMLEVVWTTIPVLILIVIAVFSFPLLYKEDVVPAKYDLTIKATGNQWNWDYEYVGHDGVGFTSNYLLEADAKAQNKPYLLGTDNPVVVPVNKIIRVQVTAPPSGVLHSWDLPAMGVKIDAVPAKLNETWFQPLKTGTYYGQCSQMCGFHHAFMPIEVKVVTQEEFDAWLAAQNPAAATASTNETTAAQ